MLFVRRSEMKSRTARQHQFNTERSSIEENWCHSCTQIADTDGSDRVSIGGRSAATARIVAVKGRAIACGVAQFGRSALARDMPSLRDTCAGQGSRGLIRFRQRPAESPAIRHYYAQGLSVFSPRGEQEG